jgi:MFS family permease
MVSTSWALSVFSLDIFLEANTEGSESTGFIRGTFITMANMAFAISPFISGYLVSDGEYGRMFFLAAAFAVPIFALTLTGLRGFQNPHYRSYSLKSMYQLVLSHSWVRHALWQKFLLYTMFGIGEVYTVILLHDTLGFSVESVGTLLTFAIFAYIITEIPAGAIADKYHAIRPLALAGFLILGLTTFFSGYAGSTSILFWTALFFVNRVGAALVEVTGEAYFFKRVHGFDSDEVGLYRSCAQFGLVVGPLVGTLIYSLGGGVQEVFIASGLIVLLGIPSTIHMNTQHDSLTESPTR